MKNPGLLCLILVPVCAPLAGHAQGTFQNLDFEAANVSGYPAGTVPATNGIPGWTAYTGGAPQSSILFNNASLGEAAVSLQSTLYPPFQGQFSVLLQASFFAPDTNTAAIGQTAFIPIIDQSMTFWANTSLSGVANNMQVSLNGTGIPYFAVGSGAGYTVYAADISAFAGQTAQLLFTAFNNTYAEIDNIQFSNQPVPEPTVLGLSLFGTLLVRWRFVRRRR